MGPACAVKAIAGDSFSLLVFGFSQVAMDIQPLVHLLRGEGILHGFSHTYLGGTIIAILTLLIGKPICQLLLDQWTPDPADRFPVWLRGARVITWPRAIVADCIAASARRDDNGDGRAGSAGVDAAI